MNNRSKLIRKLFIQAFFEILLSILIVIEVFLCLVAQREFKILQISDMYSMSYDDATLTYMQMDSYNENELFDIHNNLTADEYDDFVEDYIATATIGHFHYVEPLLFNEKTSVNTILSDTARSMIVIEEDITEEQAKDFYNGIAAIPDELIDRMASDGWVFKLIHDVNNDNQSESLYKTCGLIRFKNKEILIQLDDTDDSEIHTVLHEAGHALAKIYGFEELLINKGITDFTHNELYNTYLHQYNTGSIYIYWNYEEITADLFYEYIFYPEELKYQAQNVYDAFTECLKNI